MDDRTLKPLLHRLLALMLVALPLSGMAARTSPDPLLASQIVDRYAQNIFYNTKATGMAMVAIDANQRVFASQGYVRPGSNVRPQKDSVIRIASLTKLMTSELLVKLSEQGVVRLDDPLSKYAPAGYSVPALRRTNHPPDQSGNAYQRLPREQPGGKAQRPVFVWPTHAQRWNWLDNAR